MLPPVKIPFNKPPKRFRNQIEILISHGLNIPNVQEAEFHLSQINYYRLAAYCLPFEQNHGSHQIRTGTSFNDVLNLYTFDRELRLLLLDAIERIEVSLRTQMAYHLSHRHNSAHPHLNPTLFKNNEHHKDGLTQLKKDVKRSKEDFIKHLESKYQETLPPIWAVVELMTIGQLSRWFSNIKARQDRKDITKIYDIDENIMVSFCEHLSLVRNIAAHHSRLWNRDITKKMRLPNKGPNDLLNSLWKLDNLNDRRLKKLYNTLTMTLYLMNTITPGHHWKEDFKRLVKTHSIDTTKMGFPSNWKSRPLWQ